MLVSFLISRLVTFLALRFILCGVSASPIPAPLPLDEVSESTTDLEERGGMHSGGQGTYFYPGLGACGWVCCYHIFLSRQSYLRKNYN